MTKIPEQGGLVQIHPEKNTDNHEAGDIAYKKINPAGAAAGYDDGLACAGSFHDRRAHAGNGSPGNGRNSAGTASLNAFRPVTGDGWGGGNER